MRKLFWCLDPLEEGEDWKKPIKAIESLVGNSEAQVIPTYIVGHDLLHWVGNITPTMPHDLLPHILEKMQEKLKTISLAGLSDINLSLGGGYSVKADAKALLKVLRENEADICVVNTKARKGVARLFMGSFSESLLYEAELPLLFVSPQTKLGSEGFQRCMMTTDFSEASEKVFNELLNLRFRVGKELILYSKIAYPVNAIAQTMTMHLGGGWISLEEYMKDYISRVQETADKWKSAAVAKGFKVTTVIDDAPGDLVTDILSQSVKEKADLIVMGAKVSRSEHFFFGSTTREVIRHTTVPVLAWHPTPELKSVSQ